MNSMKALSVIFIFFLSLVTFSSGDLIEDVCGTSSDFKVCIDALRADPKRCSTDKKGLVRILLQQCSTKANSIYNEVASLLEQAKEHVLIQCLQICKENYDNAIDDATSAIKYFDANDFLAARTSTVAIASAPDTCEETFNEPPVRISPIKSKDDDFMNFIGLTMRDLIEDVCRTSSDFKVCIDALRADPKSSSADKKGLVHILLQQCLAKAKSIYNEIVSLLEQAKEHVLIQCLQVCKENYDSSIDDAETAIKDFDANDFPGAMSAVSDVVSAPDTCEETFNESVKISPIKSKDDDFMNFINLTASLINQFGN
ncbi:cell wall / vacuolar inhibitor of fructosidase 1-like [Solanum stenotomum]|uniref:cell wall / vacuolar inhibitor of fructosidase 1-like n=1 Tax=Solanum stenotomum TaxID=172797 RepID=UPI0020D14CF2|nr:cell wall / vacuolar inhibitor of fructosidase 1-like [Solanum stenotomum]